MKKFVHKAKILFIPCEKNHFKPRFLTSDALVYYVIALLILKLVSIVVISGFPKTNFFADLSQTSLFQLTNQERVASGLVTLKENPILNQAAHAKAQDMINNDYFAHQSPIGITPWYWFKQAGYSYQLAGENLAVGFVDSEEVVNAWENSPSHKANLLNPNFQEMGIAVVTGNFQGAETSVVVQLFGSPLAVKNNANVKTSPIVKQLEVTVINTPLPVVAITTPQETPKTEQQNQIAGVETIKSNLDDFFSPH